GALETFTFQSWRLSGHGGHFLHVTVAVKNQIATSRKDCLGSLREIPRKRLHRRVVAHQKAFKADLAPDDLRYDLTGGRGGIVRVDRRIDDMAGHRHRQVVEGCECCKIMPA